METFDSFLSEFQEQVLPKLTPRLTPLVHQSRKAGVVIGMRRTGKTWLCFQEIQDLLARGVSKERCLYLNFEDDRLLDFRLADFQLLLDAFYRRSPGLKNKKCYFYFDEIQRIEGWELFIRRLLDTENVQVTLTGSSAKLLAKEIATSLRGRSQATELFPFSFAEYLRFHGVESPTRSAVSSRTKAILEHHLQKYFRHGGFPEILDIPDDLSWRGLLQSYVDVVLFRDVVERHRVSNTASLRRFVHHLMEQPARRLSLNKVYRTMRDEGLSCTKNDLFHFLDYLEDAYFCFTVPIHSPSLYIRRVNPPKVYGVDVGLWRAMGAEADRDRGSFLENLIFLHLRRKGIHPTYFVTTGGKEVDFIYTDWKTGKKILLQVCWSLKEPVTALREIEALREAMKEQRIQKGTIVTWLEEKSPDSHIDVTPAWKFLLDL